MKSGITYGVLVCGVSLEEAFAEKGFAQSLIMA
jgi:hypothetical protein